MSNFWKSKKLAEMTTQEWETLCDGCGKCCLNKLEDDETGEVFFTRIVCDLIDLNSCRCMHYKERTTLVPDCLDLNRHDFVEYNWLPVTCAYRLLNNGEQLPSWHPLVSEDEETVKEAGVSICSYAMKAADVDDDDLENHIIEWLE